MTPPTLRQRVRSAIRMFARAEGDGLAAAATLEEATAELGIDALRQVAIDTLGLRDGFNGGGPPTPLQATFAEIRRDEAEALLRRVAERIHDDGHREMASQVGEAIDVLAGTLPPIMGAKDAAEMLGMITTNLHKLSPPMEPDAVISGRIPVFLRSKVEAVARRRAAR